MGCSRSYKKRIEYIECNAKSVIKAHNANIDLHIPTIDSMIKKKACSLVLDSLQSNVCDAMQGYFAKIVHGEKTRTEFGRKGVYFSAAKEYNTLPLQARRTDSRLLFRQFLDRFSNNF